MIRSLLVFVAALTLGALTVSGQEDPQDALRRQIRELTEQLKKRADQRGPGDENSKPVLRIYQVGDLVMRAWNAPADMHTDLIPSKYQPREPREESEPVAPFEIDFLIDVMRQVVEPETWEAIEGAELQVRSNRLFVTNIPRVQNKIPAFLDALRGAANRHLRVEVTAVPIEDGDVELLASRPRELTDAEAEKLLAREPLGAATLLCRSGQQVTQRSGREVSYMQDYDVEIAQEATIGDPIAQTVLDGVSIWMSAFLDDSANGVRLDLRMDRTALEHPIRRVDTEHGPLELPVLEMTRVRTALWAPLGKTVVVGGATAGTKPCVFLATVHRLGGK
ncbi:MAG: hypothetical protein ACYTHK_11285 [Planctomycetota bacterium]|jgi:hypothetical protein